METGQDVMCESEDKNEGRIVIRGFYFDEITNYVKLVLGFDEVPQTPVLFKTNENGGKIVFLETPYVIFHVHDGYHLYIPGYDQNPVNQIDMLVLLFFQSSLTYTPFYIFRVITFLLFSTFLLQIWTRKHLKPS